MSELAAKNSANSAKAIMAAMRADAHRIGVSTYGLVTAHAPIPGGTIVWKCDGKSTLRLLDGRDVLFTEAEAERFLTECES